jgi:GNAT superfamily N-acetyltransferase
MPSIQVVPFDPRFAQGVVAVILQIQQAEFGIAISLDDQRDLQDIRSFYQRGAGNFWLAVAGDTVVGTLGLLDIGNNRAALRKMFVKAEYRGAGFAVAGQLLATLLAWCRAQSVRAVYLGTTAKFLAAHRFYEKNGFTEISRADLPPAFPVMVVDTKFYRHELSHG